MSESHYEEFKMHFIALCENTGKWYSTQELMKIIPIKLSESTINKYMQRMRKEKVAKTRNRPVFGRITREHTIRSDKL